MTAEPLLALNPLTMELATAAGWVKPVNAPGFRLGAFLHPA